MTDLIRHEPFFGKYMFSHQGDLYLVDGPIEPTEGSLVTTLDICPQNGLSVPAKVQIQVTNRCNLKCPHCYVASGAPLAGELTDLEIKSFLQACQQTGVLQIQWSGGDPFVRKGFLALVQYAHSLGFEQDILTNGVALGRNSDLASELWKYVHAVQVSMDGYGENFDIWVGKHAWDPVLKSIASLVATKPEYGRVSVATTLDRKNLTELGTIGETLSDLGVSAWLLARQVRNGRSLISEDEADELLFSSYSLLQEMRERNAKLPSRVLHPFDKGTQNEEGAILPVEWITEPAARTFLYVSANGDVYPFPYFDGYAEWASGNIREASLLDLWHSEPFNLLRAATRSSTGCGGCKRICQLWSRWFNYGRKSNICEPPINHPTCTSRTWTASSAVIP